MVDWHVIDFNFIGLGNMDTLIGIAIIIILRLAIPWLNRKLKDRAKQKAKANGSSAGNTQTRKKKGRKVVRQTQPVADNDPEVVDVSPLEQPDLHNSTNWDLQQQERERIEQAEILIQQAKSAIASDTSNPFDSIDSLLAAIEFYKKSYLLVNKDSCIQAIEGIQLEIDRRHQFQSLIREATATFYHKQFGQALTTLFLAQQLYSPPQLTKTIAECEEKAKGEKIYLQSLAEAKTLSYAGRFREALGVIDRALVEFPRQDGEDLKVRLNRVVAAKEQFNLGKVEHKIGNITAAKYHYHAAIHLIPDWQEPQLQLAIIEAQSEASSAAIVQLTTTSANPQTKCLAGLLYAKQGQFDRALATWSELDLQNVRSYHQADVQIEIAQCQLIQTQIKELVDRGELEQARTISLEFVDRFGSNSAIETNLKNCILPGIEAKIWKSEDWQNIAVLTRENWSSQPTIASLHNWTTALYYATQINYNLEELIGAWATAIANIDLDPSLQNLPWLQTKASPVVNISDKLWQLLEQRIEVIKDVDSARYLHLRDLYRQEFWAMELARAEPAAKIKIGDLTILPGCYQRYYSQISLGEAPQLWKTLYTNWGKAVAACLAGDRNRAETIKVDLVANTSLETFAARFIFYQQGCYYLQQEQWQQAIYPLNDANINTYNDREWWHHLDELFDERRRKIDDFDEHINFAQFWYDLLVSPQSEDYLIQYKALKIQREWGETIVSDELSLSRIKELQATYPQHPVAREIAAQIQDYCWKNQ
jgi:tetratricopeptide (TPR) repeat protein